MLIADAALTMHGERVSSIDFKRLKGEYADYFRIRKGDARIILRYEKDEIFIVTVAVIGLQGDIYK